MLLQAADELPPEHTSARSRWERTEMSQTVSVRTVALRRMFATRASSPKKAPAGRAVGGRRRWKAGRGLVSLGWGTLRGLRLIQRRRPTWSRVTLDELV